ncbi:helix-turn-helix domain-containing protein [Roseomonas elaeocarpi]|uniref:Helix-turn-helix domain-containing protein n=1 Tax=Roseomonas elaeocarpi TaxID=907779 RepID=A0ABV6JTA1_9PROT
MPGRPNERGTAVRPLNASALPLRLTVPAACGTSGLSRASLYRALARGDFSAQKCGRRTLIDGASFAAWLDRLPSATFRAPAGTEPRT